MTTRMTRSRASLGTPGSGSLAKSNNGSEKKQPSKKSGKQNSKPQAPRSSPNTARKRKHSDVKKEEQAEENEEPMMSGARQDLDDQVKQEEDIETPEPLPKRRSRSSAKRESPSKPSAGNEMASAAIANRDSQYAESNAQKSSRAKNNPYGLSPGISPFPTFSAPTRDQCQEVNDLLSEAHGAVSAPKTIPQPSLNSSGCGEVPSVLDALVRTRLSAATNGANSSRAFRGLVEKFGIIKEGIGKGSVNWERVRQAPVKDVYEAIKAGGLADVKSKDIQAILNMVKEENAADRKKRTEDEGNEGAMEARKSEISKAEEGVLSLDHLHTMADREAMDHLLRYPGVGPKTASCVLLFCMQRPSFAVDTHVFRLTRWLGWVPTDAQVKSMWKRGECKGRAVGRESAYAHLETKVPDELKYPLHYLLIKHGKNCGWCSAKAGTGSKVGKTCPLAHLMSGKGRSKGLPRRGKLDAEENESSEDSDEVEGEENSEDDKDELKEAHGGS